MWSSKPTKSGGRFVDLLNKSNSPFRYYSKYCCATIIFLEIALRRVTANVLLKCCKVDANNTLKMTLIKKKKRKHLLI